jgi:uncharacterized RDD family membrane protein YckC
MGKINIATAQNVTIEYELATIQNRATATILDIFIVYVGSLLILGIVSLLKINSGLNYFYILVPASFLYHLLMETLNHGQTLGKKAVHIRVVKINGERPAFFDFMARTIFRVIDISLTFGTLAFITITSSEKGQRLGDFFAETTVVKLINLNRFSLSRILSMEKLKMYTPSYPGVIVFKEEEMLLIKETLERYYKFPNESHIEARDKLVKKIEGQLSIVAPRDRNLFLNTLIKDYVSLTR